MSKKPKIFLSYSYNHDNPLQQRLIRDLSRSTSLEIWNAQERISLGDSIFEEISKAINDSDYFLQIGEERIGNYLRLELQTAFVSQVAKQNVKIIIARINETRNYRESITITKHIFDFTKKYDKALDDVLKFLGVNSENSLVKFTLDLEAKVPPIISISKNVNEELIKHFTKHPEELKVINRRKFEEIVAELFDSFGYKVELTQQTRDGGRDIIAIKNSEANLKYLIECKRPDPGNPIGIKPVRELFGVKNDEKATKAILATTSYFSKDALQFFERNKWELEPKDFNGLMSWIEDYKKIKNIS